MLIKVYCLHNEMKIKCSPLRGKFLHDVIHSPHSWSQKGILQSVKITSDNLAEICKNGGASFHSFKFLKEFKQNLNTVTNLLTQNNISMGIRFYVANEEFLQKLEGYIKYKAETSRDQFSEVPSRIFMCINW